MQFSLLIAILLFSSSTLIEDSPNFNPDKSGKAIQLSIPINRDKLFNFQPSTFNFQPSTFNFQPSTNKHDFHVSIIDVNHNPEKKTLEVSLKVFIDDLEKALTEEDYAPTLFLNTKKENQNGDTYIKAYLNKNFKITVNGEVATGNYLGKEYENDVCWIYIEYPDIKKPKNISIQNTMLLNTYSDQANIIHFKSGTTKHSKALQSQDFIMSFNL